MMDAIYLLRAVCGHDSFSVDGCQHCVAADEVEALRRDASRWRASALDPLRDQLRAQGCDGNWDYDEYMNGLYNGLECALATLEGRNPEYRDKPLDGWCADRAAALSDEPQSAVAAAFGGLVQTAQG